ncbi:hypothetical protein [Natronorubrum sp. A-ect3]|uniref:hypothetical protein n=1 Tax=Natronorubrum sp. A-ect3 TaxID=3242698 RepID=UPI00359DAB4C
MDQEHTLIDTVRHRVAPALTTLADGGERVLGERPTMEHVLLLLFLVVGVYMYQGASEFAPSAQTFPRIMAGATVVFSVLLLVRNYLTVAGPVFGVLLGGYLVYVGGSAFLDTGDGLGYLIPGLVLLGAAVVFRERFGAAVESFVAEPVQVMGGDDVDKPPQTDEDSPEADTESETEDENGSAAMYVYDIDDPRGPVVTGALCVVYMLLTFSIGMLYATPIFVALWTLWVRMDTIRAVAMTVGSFVIALLFYDFVERDVARGWLTGWQPPTPIDLLALSSPGNTVLPHATDGLAHAVAVLQWGVIV